MDFLKDKEIDESAKGMTMASLKKSRQIRRDLISKYGMIPSSILKQKRADKALDLSHTKRDYRKGIKKSLIRKGMSKIEAEIFETRYAPSGQGGLSKFPQNVGRLIVNFYCPEKGIVYDPFAGHNSRMELVYETKRSYIGVDVSKEFMEDNWKIKNLLLSENVLIKNPAEITLIEGSSAKGDLPDNYADFTITSPPYWDIEYYGDEPEQLGKNKTYDSFLDSLSLHIQENYRILKPSSFCAWFVNDFKKGGVLLPYHSDLIYFFQEAGFELFSIYIVDLGNTFGEIFAQQIEKTKVFPKRHEYCLLFQKPK